MNWILLKKELWQNGLWFVLLGVLTVVFLGAFAVGSNISGAGGGTFAGIGAGLLLFFPIPMATLAYMLVAAEFRNRTQLFLEALPLPRWRMIAVKWVLGLFLAVSLALSGIAILWLFSIGEEILSVRFIGILATKAGLWAAFVFGFFFVMGFMGRYRIPIFFVLFLGFATLGNGELVRLGDFPPFALMHMSRFGFEREVWPVNQIVWTAAIVVGWVAFSFAIGLARDGTVAAKLGEKMSYREKMFIGAVLFGGLIGAMFAMEHQMKPEKFDLPGGVSEERSGVLVKISAIDPEHPVDEIVALGAGLAESLAEKRDWLGISQQDWPSLYVTERVDMENEDGELLEPGYIANDEENSVLMYANFRAKEFEVKRFEAAVIGEMLQVYTLGRVAREHRWWLVCGMQGEWELGSLDPAEVEPQKGDLWKKMAHDAVTEAGLEVGDVLGWLAYQEEVTWQSADAVAWMGMCYLKREIGEEKIQQLAREILVHRVKRKDSRAVLWDWFHPVPDTFEKVSGISFADFVKGWREYIETETIRFPDGKKEVIRDL